MNNRPMTKLTSLLFLLFCLSLASGPIRAGSVESNPRAEKRLWAYLEKKLPPRGLSLDCVTLILEDSTAKYLEYAVREKHDGNCPGDPAVAPIVDRYRVPLKKGSIQTYNPVEDDWR